MISVIIPLYNKRRTIEKTLRSILNQTYKDLEIIVVDDGSTDGGAEEAEKFGEKVKVIKDLGHFGANWARNYGAHRAQGDYLFFCDADIILRPDALAKMLAALQDDKNAAFAYSSFKLGWKTMPGHPFDAEALKKCNYISTMSLLRRNDFPGFDEKIEKFQDWDLWLTMAERGRRGVFVPQVLFYASPTKGGKSRWLPKIFYKIPWKIFGIKIGALQNYNKALAKIKTKHGL